MAAGKAQQRMQSLLNGLVNPDDETIANEVGSWKPPFMCWSEDVDPKFLCWSATVDGSEIRLTSLMGSLSHYLQGFIHPRWCRISSINSMLTLAVFFIKRVLVPWSSDIWPASKCQERRKREEEQQKATASWMDVFPFNPFISDLYVHFLQRFQTFLDFSTNKTRAFWGWSQSEVDLAPLRLFWRGPATWHHVPQKCQSKSSYVKQWVQG